MNKITVDESYEYNIRWLEKRIIYYEKLLSEIEKKVGKDIINECVREIIVDD